MLLHGILDSTKFGRQKKLFALKVVSCDSFVCKRYKAVPVSVKQQMAEFT